MFTIAKKAAVAITIAASALVLAGQPAGAHPHTVDADHDGVAEATLAKSQNHAPFVNGVSCGGDPAAYGLETAHHGPDAGVPGRADDACYQTTGSVPPAQDVANPVIR